jgi:hypothetical protein
MTLSPIKDYEKLTECFDYTNDAICLPQTLPRRQELNCPAKKIDGVQNYREV